MNVLKWPTLGDPMASHRKHLFVAAAILLTTGAVAVPAAARVVSPYPGGRSLSPADANCFNESFGGVVNNCSTSKHYIISLPVDSAGSKTAKVGVYGPNANGNVSCSAWSVSANLLSSWTSGSINQPQFGTPTTIAVTTTVPTGGALYVICNVGPNGQVHSVNFNQ